MANSPRMRNMIRHWINRIVSSPSPLSFSIKGEECKIFYFIVLFLISLSCSRNHPLGRVGKIEIQKKALLYQIEIDRAYGNPHSDTISAVFEIIQNFLREQVAEANKIQITERTLEKESERIDKETKAPQILSNIKKIFGRNKSEYLIHYVKPISVIRLLQQKFFFDSLYQSAPYKKIKQAYSKVKHKKTIKNTTIKIFTPKEKFLDYYKSALNKGITEEKYAYYFVKKRGKKIEVYLVSKNNYTDWFRKEASKYPVIIYDKALRQRILRRIKGNKFWESIVK